VFAHCLVLSHTKPFIAMARLIQSCSQAVWPKIRSRKYPHGLPNLTMSQKQRVRLGNLIAKNCLDLAKIFALRGAAVTIENPDTSMLWHTKYYKGLFRAMARDDSMCIKEVKTDYCRFGVPYKKRTRITTIHTKCFAFLDDTFLPSVGILCQGGHQHTTLSGWKPKPKANASPAAKAKAAANQNRPTAGTAEYPPLLCAAWAKDVATYLDSSCTLLVK
jgi:hypothetical protein